MKQSILIFIVLYFSVSALCQNSLELNQNSYNVKSSVKKQINLLGEVGGNGLLFSFGLEQAKYEYNVLKNTIRCGFSIFEYSIFGEYNINFGKNKNYFELGAGPTLHYDQGLNLLVFGRIGYRYISDRFIFRAGFTPFLLIGNGSSPYLRPHFGMTLGIPLKRN